MNNDSDTLVRYSHRSLWAALLLLLVLAAWAVAVNLFPASAALAGKVALLLPLAIVIALAVLRGSLRGLSGHPASAAMKAVLHDELRRQSLQRGWRNGLLAVLLAQPLLAMLLAVAAPPAPVLLMASLTVLIGVATVLASVLVYDR